MKRVLFASIAVVTSLTCAAEPTLITISSCLHGTSQSSTVRFTELPTTEINSQDDYQAGYDSPFFITVHGRDIGYAERKNKQALIYQGRLYPIENAKSLLQTTMPPSEFEPHLATWAMISEGRKQYFCVSFNFSGLGQSGSYQNIRGGYLLAKSGHLPLYYVVADIRKLP